MRVHKHARAHTQTHASSMRRDPSDWCTIHLTSFQGQRPQTQTSVGALGSQNEEEEEVEEEDEEEEKEEECDQCQA